MLKNRWLDRYNFASYADAISVPNLLDIQLQEYEKFIQKDVEPEEREIKGLHKILTNIFPVSDTKNRYTVEYVNYSLGEPKYTVDECRERGVTFSAPLQVQLKTIIRDIIDGEYQVRDVIEQKVFLGELPLLTDSGTFVINGAERVIVNQLHRSPGIFFESTAHPTGKTIFSARIIPNRGSWLEFIISANDAIFAYIDSRKKIPAAVLLKALGISDFSEFMAKYYQKKELDLNLQEARESALNQYLAKTVIDESTGEILAELNQKVTEDLVDKFDDEGIQSIEVWEHEDITEDRGLLINTFARENILSENECLEQIYKLMRPGEPPSFEAAKRFVRDMFFDLKRYDLSEVGRYKINRKFEHGVSEELLTLDIADIYEVFGELVSLRRGRTDVDDIDHLANRRIRSVGELLENQFYIGLSRVARVLRERLNLQDFESFEPYELINTRSVSSVIQTFFGSSQLSQFMDQINPLAELTHKRRLSALGPGGLTRERAGFEVRDVHYTHYGRICPIETPEGPNIGLITSLSIFARINDLGFIETPYRLVKDGIVTNEIVYIQADVEENKTIAHCNTRVDENGKILDNAVTVRAKGDFINVKPSEVDLMDVSSRQMLSVSASLIPFLENNAANRALMGSNMQRQAVPLIRPQTPFIGTGMEYAAVHGTGSVVVARRGGLVKKSTSEIVIIEADSEEICEFGKEDIYVLKKYKRSNQDTCVNQRPLVKEGMRVIKGDVIADGMATDKGELALGMNVLVAFMPWNGYNFEDAIIISERIVRKDYYASIHIQEFSVEVRETKRGAEELVREIPNVSDDMVRNLDDTGIIRVGAKVKSGDILVGKITLQGERELSPEEKLLKAIFAEKVGEYKDTSLRVKPGVEGTVIDVKIYSRKEKDRRVKRTRLEEERQLSELEEVYEKEIKKIELKFSEKLEYLLVGKTFENVINKDTGELMAEPGTKITKKLLKTINFEDIDYHVEVTDDSATNEEFQNLIKLIETKKEKYKAMYERERNKIIKGDELPPGVLKVVKVYIAQKRKLEVGDKMAGRHGNKGVVSSIVPVEDMPFMENGTSIDIILNPLGVPSRMNIGQILETTLGWAAGELGIHVATPSFDGATVEDIKKMLTKANLPKSGKIKLRDGKTGLFFDNEVTVGYIYILKLYHLVDNKIHARATGSYSLITQQPLGGKAQFGGQRFGEMEVWALEAYGAAYTLQELLTVKSDDVEGRSKVYEAIVKGENTPDTGTPESFNVLVKELQCLGIDVRFE